MQPQTELGSREHSFAHSLIHVEHLSRMMTTRARKTTILDDVIFRVPVGSPFTISRSSGSGKSTLLNMRTGIDRPDSGRVFFGHYAENCVEM